MLWFTCNWLKISYCVTGSSHLIILFEKNTVIILFIVAFSKFKPPSVKRIILKSDNSYIMNIFTVVNNMIIKNVLWNINHFLVFKIQIFSDQQWKRFSEWSGYIFNLFEPKLSLEATDTALRNSHKILCAN